MNHLDLTQALALQRPVEPGAWRKLYDDLGEEITMASNTASDIETSDGLSLALSYKVEGMQRARELMRGVDSTLPTEEADEL